jgi:hypothetical protein
MSTQCCCGRRVRCQDCRKDICFCQCHAEEPIDAVLAGHGITTEVPDPRGTPSNLEMANS